MKNKGFTLVEVIATISILAILAVIATTSVTRHINNSRESAKKQTISNVEDAALVYALRHDIRIPDECAITTKVTDDKPYTPRYSGCVKYTVKVQTLIDEAFFKDDGNLLDRNGEVLIYKLDDGNNKELKAFASNTLFKTVLAQSKFTPNVKLLDDEKLTESIELVKGRAVGTLPFPVKEGYVFAGWYLDETLTNKLESETVINDTNITLYPKWLDTNLKSYITNMVNDDTIVYDNTVDKNIRYSGPEVNNYIYLNCTGESDSTCELWRIIGIVKGYTRIVKDEPLSKTMAYHDGTGRIDDWEDTTLYQYLNTEYFQMMNKEGLIYDGLIVQSHDPSYSEGNTALETYQAEFSKSFYDYFGLLTINELLYSMPKDKWNGDEYEASYSWIKSNNPIWLQDISKTINNADYNEVYTLQGYIRCETGSGVPFFVRPVTSLRDDVKIANAATADGSKAKPFRLTK